MLAVFYLPSSKDNGIILTFSCLVDCVVNYRMIAKNTQMIGVDLFAGAGGMSLGAAQAGVDVCLAIEIDEYATETYSHNHPNTKVIKQDIRKLKEINLEAKKIPKVIFGGPPCQGFSTSNQKTRNCDNPDNWLFREYFRLVKSWRPDWVIFENVQGISGTEDGMFLELILKEFKKAGYRTSWWILDASYYGVPQKRNRLFVIGSLHGIEVKEPNPITDKPVTVKDAIFDLPDLENGTSADKLPYKKTKLSNYAKTMRGNLKFSSNHLVTKNTPLVLKRYRYIPQGGNWRNIPSRLMRNYTDRTRCHTGIYHRLREDEPSIVIANYRKNMLIHPIQDRGLSVREAARFQSFPDWYEFKGSIGFQQQQVGNAVPPLLAKRVFESIVCYT